MHDDNDKKKLHKVAKGTSIAAKVVLVLFGLAFAGFLAWLGYNVYEWLKVGL